MPKRKRSGRIIQNNHALLLDIKEEIIDEEVFIKSEPIDNGYELIPNGNHPARTLILNDCDKNRDAVEREFGLVSHLEIVKSEVNVDEEIVNEFREEIKRMSIDTAPITHREGPGIKVARKRKRVTKEEDKKKKKKKKAAKIESEKTERKSKKEDKVTKSVEPLEIQVNGKKMVKCPFCDKTATTRDRSLVKEHIRLHTGETPFGCNYCDRKFMFFARLQSHIESYHKKTRSKCSLCRRIFFEDDEFHDHQFECVKRRYFECHLCHWTFYRMQPHVTKEHMRIHHTGEKAYNCKYCNEEFLRSCGLSSHLRRFHPEAMPYQCSKCEVRFQDDERFQKHFKHCLTKRSFECYICRYSHIDLSSDSLKLHMRKHTCEKPHQCHLCKKYFPRTEALQQHLQRHRDIFKLKCSKCRRGFISQKELEKHEEICRQRRYECHLCGFTKYGISFNKFNRHMATLTGVKNIQCHGCTKSFTTYPLFASHVYANHPKLIPTICPNCCHRFETRRERDAHQYNCTKCQYECHICRFWLKSEDRLKSHMISKHLGARKFRCKICKRTFDKKHNFVIHMKSHTKIGVVKCQYCPKTFADIKYKKKHEFRCRQVFECYLCKMILPKWRDLHGEHMKTHLGSKPYDCRHCSTSIGSVRCYDLHVINHHLHLYKFQCNICKGFVLKRKDFRVHQKSCVQPIRKSQGVIYFKCYLCGKGLARLPELRKHILNGECKNHPKKVR